MISSIQQIIKENIPKIENEIKETKELYELLIKWSTLGTISKEEKKKIHEQLLDIVKSIPALAIFLAPFGSIILILLIKYLPFNILPSSFNDDDTIKLPESDEKL